MTDEATDSLWTRLRRRKVVQWGVAYAAGSWGLLQGLGYASATFQWPPILQQLATLALLTGLPIVLVLAWYHGDRGQQRVSGAELAIITLLFVIGGLMFWRYERGTTAGIPAGVAAGNAPAAPGTAATGAAAGASDAAARAAAAATNAAEAPANSIAVLPFVNMSGDPANEYFSDGISEEILNVLAKSAQLQVAARTSSFTFKGKDVEVPEIARELKVRMVLEGSVRRQEEKVRVTAQLIDAKTGFHVWSETYDRELKDIFAIQDEIARAIGEKMKVQVVGAGSSSAAASRTANPDAHDHYLRGLALWQTRNPGNLWQAIDEFNKAIAIDPKYAEAYGGLALAYTVIADYSGRITFEDAATGTTAAAEMALALDPSMPEPYAALGNLAANERRRVLAKTLLQRAIALRPSFATAYQWLGTAVAAGGDPESGLGYAERSSTLDPRSLIVADNHALVLSAIGRYDDAKAVCQRILTFAPDFFQCLVEIGVADIMLGRPEEARRSLLRTAELANPSATPLVNEMIDALSGRGDRHALALRLGSFAPRSNLEPGSGNVFDMQDVPPLIMALGEPQVALDYIERHAGDPYGTLDWGMVREPLDPIRCDPRFRAAAKKLAINDVRAAKLCAASKPSG